MRIVLALIPIGALVAFASGCAFQHESSLTDGVTAPASATTTTTTSTTTTPLDSVPVIPGQPLTGSWVSDNLPNPSSCGNFQWDVLSQTPTSIAGNFIVTCPNSIIVSGTANGQLVNGNDVQMAANGNAAAPGLPLCAFSLTGTGTIVDNSSLTINYTGTTCLGPVKGTETLKKKTSAAPAPDPTPVVQPPAAPAPPITGSGTNDEWHDYFFTLIAQTGAGPTVTQNALNILSPGLNQYGAAWQNDLPYLGRADFRPRIYLPKDGCAVSPGMVHYGATPLDCTWSRFVDVGDYGGPWQWLVR
jgi:hypothetical protein